MRRWTPFLLALALAAGAPAPAVAQDGAFQKIFRAYQRDGTLDPCKYSAKDLRAAKDQVPKDFEQYSPDFETALDAALQQRATGGCRKAAREGAGTTEGGAAPAAPTAPTPPAAGTTGTPGAVAGATGTTGATMATAPQPTPAPTPAPAAADRAITEAVDAAPAATREADDTPAPLILLAVLALLALAALALAGAVRVLAWEPAWLLRARHASAEAGWRAGNTWSEFSDWVRLGR